MDLESIFNGIAKKLKVDFETITSEIEHKGLKGHAREKAIIREFLTKILPKRIGIDSECQMFASTGDISNECDIVLYDEFHSPILKLMDETRTFPVETIYGVIEVKSRLELGDLESDHKKITRVKKMVKRAFAPQAGVVKNVSQLYGCNWDYFPTLGFIFSYDSIDLFAIRDKLNTLQKDHVLHERIDSVWVFNKGMIVNQDKQGMVCHTPTKETELKVVLSDNPLMLLTVHLQQLLQAAWMPKFDILMYLPHVNYGRIESR